MIGTRLGPYEITAKLGEGGMGEVYRATDSRLKRDVAIKVLPPAFVADSERLARFEREAQLLAQLHHPHIASIFGLEESEGVRGLVMELVEGPTLAEKLGQGRLPIDEVLPIARQIAEALEAAHEKGIIHRDLKPQNVKLAADGSVKVLDFGLAKAMDATGSASGAHGASHLAASPTLTLGATQMGVVLGTAAYMSPEQAKGLPVDKRCDIWALGVVLFEMLTGRRLFEGDSVPETLAGVLKSDIDLAALPPDVPRSVRQLLRRCLERDPRKRLRDIGDASFELAEPGADTIEPTLSARPARPVWTWLLLAAVPLFAGFALARIFAPPREAPSPPVRARLSVELPSEAPLASGNFLPSLAFSPDGKVLAYVAAGTDGVRRLAIRPLDTAEVRIISDSEGAEGPFFSPDGEWIGFWSKWKIRKVRASGLGVSEVLCGSRDYRGGAWVGHQIIFSPGQGTALVRVDDRGGTPEPLTQLLPGEANHRFPVVLPDGDTLLFTAWKSPFDVDRSTLFALSLATGKRKELGTTSHLVLYSPSGHLLYAQAGRLLAVPFDVGKLEITGAARAILDHLVVQKNTGAAQFAVSPEGALAWAAGDLVGTEVRIARVDRGGTRSTILETDTVRRYPKLSPDDREYLVQAIGPEVDGAWLESLDRRTHRRLRSGVGSASWLPDGGWVYTEVSGALFTDAVDGSSARREVVPASARVLSPTGATADGTIAYSSASASLDLDSWIFDGRKGEAQLFLGGPASDGGVTFSPDGRYAAYISDKSGDFEVYVTSYPERSGSWQISTAGGSEVVWRRDGKEIVYRAGSELVSVPVTTDPVFRAGSPSVLFRVPYDGVLGSPDYSNFDVSRDGSWFLMTENPDLNRPSSSLEIVLDWPSVLRGK